MNSSYTKLQRNFTFSLLAIAYFFVFFHRTAPGVFTENLMYLFNVNALQLGTLSAIMFYIYAIIQIPSGIMVDLYGYKKMSIIGVLLMGIGSIVFATTNTYEIAVLGRIFIGLGVSLIFVSIMKSNAIWFQQHKYGTITGITILIGNLGAMTATLPFSLILKELTWQDVYIVVGIICFIITSLIFFTLEKKLENLKKKHKYINYFKNILFILKNWQTYFLFFIQFGIMGGFSTFVGLWGIPYLTYVYRLDSSQSSLLMMIAIISFAVGSFFIGFLSDKIKNRKTPLCICIILYLLSWIFLIQDNLNLNSLYLIFILMGIGCSGFTLSYTMMKENFSEEITGLSIAIVNVGMLLGISILQPLVGFIIDSFTVSSTVKDAYSNTLIIFIIYALIGVVSSIFLKETYKNKI